MTSVDDYPPRVAGTVSLKPTRKQATNVLAVCVGRILMRSFDSELRLWQRGGQEQGNRPYFQTRQSSLESYLALPEEGMMVALAVCLGTGTLTTTPSANIRAPNRLFTWTTARCIFRKANYMQTSVCPERQRRVQIFKDKDRPTIRRPCSGLVVGRRPEGQPLKDRDKRFSRSAVYEGRLRTLMLTSIRVRPSSLMVGRTLNGMLMPSVIRYLKQFKEKMFDQSSLCKLNSNRAVANRLLKRQEGNA